MSKKAENKAWAHMAAKAQPTKPTLAATSPMQPLGVMQPATVQNI